MDTAAATSRVSIGCRRDSASVSETGWEVGQMVGVYRVTESAQVSDG